MEALPIELVQKIVFESGLESTDVLGVVLSGKGMYGKVLGALSGENEYDRDQWRATGGVGLCVQKEWWRGARLAVERGYGDVEEVVEVDWWWKGVCVLTAACVRNQVEVVRALVEMGGVDPSRGDNQAIRLASSMGCTEVVELLLGDGRVDPGARENEAIQMAAENGQVGVVELLLGAEGVDPGAGGNHALYEACLRGRVRVVELLLGGGGVEVGEEEAGEILGLVGRFGQEGVREVLLRDGRFGGEEGGGEGGGEGGKVW